MNHSSRRFSCFVLGTCIALNMNITIAARESSPPKPQLVSIVDYLKAEKVDSSFENRRQLFNQQWANEDYKGTSKQNLKLLHRLLSSRKQVGIPFPSSKIEDCKKFYDHPEVSKYLSQAFASNALSACVVTGTSTAHNKIRIELQKAYKQARPANGKTFSASEHKAIHDKAYEAAGCKEDSAKIVGWHIVNAMKLPDPVIDYSIRIFGSCTTVKQE